MDPSGSVVLGVTGVLLGLVFFALAMILIRAISRVQPVMPTPIGIDRAVESPESSEAVLLVQTGGRILFANPVAREWFGVLEEELNLERLARRARPSDQFIGLCATEGQSRFSVNGIYVEGESHFLPYGRQAASLVTLRRPQITDGSGETFPGKPSHRIDIITELSQAMASSLDLETTIKSILDSVERLIPSDFSEMTVWDGDHQYLIPYRYNSPAGLDRQLMKSNDRYLPEEGYTGYLVQNQEPLLIPDIEAFRDVRPVIDRKQYPINSYLGLPLIFAGEFVGTLELSALTQNAFSANDLETLKVLSRQAAVAVHNATIYEAEQHRVLELSGLAQLAQAAGALYDPKNMYYQLVDSIKPLFQVEVIGFWIYDEVQHTLEARIPFLGIPEQFFTFESYTVPILPDSPAEAILHSQEIIQAFHTQEDQKLSDLGILGLIQAAGIDSTVLAPLPSGGRLLGYLQVGDKLDGTAFDTNDLRILTIVAGQAAMIIENAALVQQTQRRAQRSEALRRIASLTGSAATLDEILQFSLRELARLLQADLAAIFLYDENLGELRIHKASLFGISEEISEHLSKIAFPTLQSTPANIHTHLTANALGDTEFLSLYRPFVELLQVRSGIDVQLIVQDHSLGKLFLASAATDFFDRSDLTTIDTAAGQLAGAIERASLSVQTDDTLRRRVEQLTAITRISRELNTSLDLQYLLQYVHAEVLRTTRAQCGSILLLQPGSPPGQLPAVIFQIGDEHADSLLPVESLVLQKEEPIIINNYDTATEQPAHPGVASSLIVPIAYEGRVAGLFHLHSPSVDCFDATALEIAQTLAIQAAVALGNAQRYQEQVALNELLSRRVETLANLMETTRSLQAKQTLEESLEDLAYGIQESTPFNVVLISVYETKTGTLRNSAQAGLSISAWEDLRVQCQAWTNLQENLLPEFRIGRSYFIPGDNTPLIPDDIHYIYAQTFQQEKDGNATWNKDDRLLIPLLDASGEPLGLIDIANPRDGLRPDRPTLETLDIFASQAALSIESQLKLKELGVLSQTLQNDLNRIQTAVGSTQDSLQVLLHKDLDQTLAIQSLSQRVKRIRAGLDIAEIINRQPDRTSILLALGREILTRMDFDAALVADGSSESPRLIHTLGAIPAGTNPEALFGQRNPLRQILNSGENLFLANLNESPDWKSSPLLQALDTRGLVCLAVPAENSKTDEIQIEAAILAVKRSPGLAITKEDEQIYLLLARQTAVALQNLRLLSETNRRLQEVNLLLEFSRQLGSLDPTSILDTLAQSAMRALPAASTCLVALWDPEQNSLVPKAASGYIDRQSILEINYPIGIGLPGLVYQDSTPLRIDDVDFARHYQLPSEDLLRYRKAAGGRLPVSALAVPIGGGQPGDRLEQRKGAPFGVILLESLTVPAAFSTEDQALIASLAQQTALTLENARLYQASEQRANQLRALTTLAATITSSLQSNELIASLLDQVRTIIPYDTGTLWLKQENSLNIRAARGFADSENRIGISVALEDSQLLKDMIETRQPISVPDVREDSRFTSLLEPEYLSWMGIPLITKGMVIGVIALEKVEAAFYTGEHIQAVMTFAGQAAVALENASLYEESLGKAQELDRRSQRLALLNRFSTELSGSLDPAYIMKVTSQEIALAVHCTSVSAIAFNSEYHAVVEVETPSQNSALPIQLPDAPLFDRLKESLGVFIIEDIYNSQGELVSPLLQPLQPYFSKTGTRALLALPLATGSELQGVLFIQNQEPGRFNQDEIDLVRTISNQSAVALQNASLFAETQRLFAETRQRSAELASLFNLGMQLSQVLEYQELVDTTFANIFDLLKLDSVMLVIKNEKGELLGQAIDHGEAIGPIQIPENAGSFSQHVLATGKPLLIGDLQNNPAPVPGYVIGNPSRSWMGVPLIIRGSVIGVLAVQSDEPERFGEPDLRMIAQAGNQLAIALDNAQLFDEVQMYAAGLEQRVDERTAQLAREHQRSQTLLGIITELSASLDMDQVLNRTLGLINDSTGSEYSLILLKNPDDDHLSLRVALGADSNGAPPARFSEELAGWVVSKRQPVLITDLGADERWSRYQEDVAPYRSLIAVPLMMGEDALGVLTLLHDHPGHFSADFLDLIQAIAKQIAVAINNSQLFGLIRDQAEHLGDMLRRQHIETSRSQAILEAVTDGVLVTDARREITLFNSSAERILGLDRTQVLGRTLEHFSGLFGKAGHTWMETIHTWSDNPDSLTLAESGMGHNEQIELDDRRVVLVSLAPVRLRKDFLGTVSIFRDITHQVEVDRLKSEFVATVSHELRTPMTSIKGYVEIMLLGAAGDLNNQQTHFLEVVKANTERLAILVNDLLDISRIEAGKIILFFQPVDLREIVRKAVEDLIQRTKDEEKPMNVQTQIPKKLKRVNGDPARIRQIIDNLLENAYFYTPENGRIVVRISQVNHEVQVDVQDNGIGVAPEDQAHIFERFYRGEDPLVLATSGTGLGLSIVSRIVEMHNGRIWVSSQGIPGEGSTFSFTLPIHEAEKERELQP